MGRNWEQSLVLRDTPILRAIQIIEKVGLQIALVTDNKRHLIGTVTDGDIRRGLLRGVRLEDTVEQVMNPRPTVANQHTENEAILGLMRTLKINQVPLVNEQNELVGMRVSPELRDGPSRENWVVLMAGGLGNRLQPLTNVCPKPLLKVGEKPILQTIIEKFVSQDLCNFYISVNYKAEMIMDYFRDGGWLGANIRYLHETQRMGTAGAMSLIPDRVEKPLLVMNGDLITEVNFRQLLDFHEKRGAEATMCVRRCDFQIPFGVIRLKDEKFDSIDEKPVQQLFVNAGIYVLNPSTLPLIPRDEYFDIPSLFSQLRKGHREVSLFPLREYWLDIGHVDDFRRANDYVNKQTDSAATPEMTGEPVPQRVAPLLEN